MYSVQYLNAISPEGTALWTENYQKAAEGAQGDIIMVRSAAMHDMELPQNLLAVARAGAGVNNIPLEKCAEAGVVVFNTPGANANSVVELALCSMLLGSRDILGGIQWVKSLAGTENIAKQVEKGKSQFAGNEVMHKKLGVVGLGAVGGMFANAAMKLGLDVYGYDPYISIDTAWHLDSRIIRVTKLEEIFETCDMISLHVPLVESTEKMIDRDALAKMKDGVLILNLARDRLVDDDAMAEALKSGKVRRYVTDFPNQKTAGMEGVIAIPHLGASTEEAEENCARMAVRQVMNYVENGNIVNSVNFPNCDLGICTSASRITILHRNIPNTLGRLTSAVAQGNINISNLMNKSRGEYAYTMLDLDHPATDDVIAQLKEIPGVLRIRVIQ